jgi:hypothetical protein
MPEHLLLQFQNLQTNLSRGWAIDSSGYLEDLKQAQQSDQGWRDLATGLHHPHFRSLLQLSRPLFADGSKNENQFEKLIRDFDQTVWQAHRKTYLRYPIPDLIAGWSAVGLAGPFNRLSWTEILNSLESTVLTKNSFVGWKTVKNYKQITNQIDLGFFHGALSALLLLSLMWSQGFEKKRSLALIKRLTHSYQLLFESPVSNLTSFYFPPLPQERERVFGWCYGDFITGLVLQVAALRLNDVSLERQADGWIQRGLGYLQQNPKTLYNPFLCHGAIGVSYLFWYLYQLSSNKSHLAACEKYFVISQEMKKKKIQGKAIDALDLYHHPITLTLAENSLRDGMDDSWDFILGFRNPETGALL